MPKSTKQVYYKCKKCGDEIYWNTHKKYTQCSCGALAVDGCEDYVRISGSAKNYTKIEKISFSDLFLNASTKERRRIMLKVARQANQDQRAIVKEYEKRHKQSKISK